MTLSYDVTDDRAQYEAELKEVERQIKDKTKELDVILPRFRDAQEEERKLRTSIAEKGWGFRLNWTNNIYNLWVLSSDLQKEE